MDNIKIGLIGCGYLGNIHAQCLLKTNFDFVGCHDVNEDKMASFSEAHGISSYAQLDSLMDQVDALIIASATTSHFDIGSVALENGKHVFIEKPLTDEVESARKLAELCKKKQRVGQVGHVERFNPAFTALKEVTLKPRFIEAHRLSLFNPRGNDVSVVKDLMIHDLDLILSMVESKVESVMANGVPIINSTADICNARVTFENGCVANITASRISMKEMRKIRIFQSDAYLAADFLKKESQIVKIKEVSPYEAAKNSLVMEAQGKLMSIDMETLKTTEENAIVTEQLEFYNAIKLGLNPTVTFEDGYQALLLAEQIEASMIKNLKS